MSDQPRSPADQLGTIIRHLGLCLDGHSTWGRLARPLAVLIMGRLLGIIQLVRRVAERVAAGTYRPRRHTKPRRPRERTTPRNPDPLPKAFGWAIRLVQETAVYGSQLSYLLRDPDMIALMAAAPTTLRRPLRSLCRMLGVIPPPILDRDRTPPPARPGSEEITAPRQEAEGVAALRREPPHPPPHARPAPAPRACGPPLPRPA